MDIRIYFIALIIFIMVMITAFSNLSLKTNSAIIPGHGINAPLVMEVFMRFLFKFIHLLYGNDTL